MSRMKWISMCLFLVGIFCLNSSASGQTNSSLSGNMAQFDVSATFTSQQMCPQYTNLLRGSTYCSISTLNDTQVQVRLRIETGEEPSGLSTSWYPTYIRRMLPTVDYPVIITTPNTTVESLSQWMNLKTRRDPSLSFQLTANQFLDTGIVYTNAETIKGKVFLIDTTQNKPVIYEFADIIFPAQAVTMSKTSSDNLNIRQGWQLTSSLVMLNNIQKKLLRQLISKKLIIRGRSANEVSTNFKALECVQPDVQNFISATNTLRASITDLYKESSGNASSFRKLIRSIDKSIKQQRRTQTLPAISTMIFLEKDLKKMTENEEIPQNDLPGLLDNVSKIYKWVISANSTIADLTFTTSPPVFSWSVTWYVNQNFIYPTSDGVSEPNGSQDYPFTSIAQAFEKSDDLSIGDLTLYVYSGVYNSPLIINKPTTLNAVSGGLTIISAPILNLSANRLNINGFYLVGAGSPGAVFVSHSDAVTSISNTIVQDATRFGIYQYGGELILDDVSVYRTQTETGMQIFGSGICLRGGVHASFTDVISDTNQSFGISIQDTDTLLIGSRLTVNSNTLNPLYADDYVADPAADIQFSGIAVRHNAVASISLLRMAQNEGEGLFVDSGASVSVNDARIINTVRYEPEGGWTGGISHGSGSAVRVTNDGYVNMTNFLLSESDLAGVVVGVGGEMDLSYGEISYNPVGAAIFDETFNYVRLTDHVRFVENGTNLQATSLPVPEVPDLP